VPMRPVTPFMITPSRRVSKGSSGNVQESAAVP